MLLCVFKNHMCQLIGETAASYFRRNEGVQQRNPAIPINLVCKSRDMAVSCDLKLTSPVFVTIHNS